MRVCMNAWAKQHFGETSWVVWQRHRQLIDKISLSFWGHMPSDFRIQTLCCICFYLIFNASRSLIQLKVVMRNFLFLAEKQWYPDNLICSAGQILRPVTPYIVTIGKWTKEIIMDRILTTFPDILLEIWPDLIAVLIYTASVRSVFQCCHPIWNHTPSDIILKSA